MLHVALYQPAIPQNVGATARTCVGIGARLHLIGPHRLDYSERAVRRAGLDYWPHLDLQLHDTPDAFLHWLHADAERGSFRGASGASGIWLITKHGTTRFDQAPYQDHDVLLFGNENTGLPEAWHDRWTDRRLCVPMPGPIRSYNLASTVTTVALHAYCRLTSP